MKSESEQIFSAFRHHLVQSGLSEKTIMSYLSDIIQYTKWLEANGDMIKLEINRYQFNRYKQQLLKQNKTKHQQRSIKPSIVYSATISTAINRILYQRSTYSLQKIK